MSSFKEKERLKEQQEKFQAILSNLLKDEDNKYCVDCDAKGPRWASWNLGIFLCIRCAGIHRNLGVHISKVKSVNLDTWTPYQVAMMQEMGNSRARAVYEANIPDGFRRPQSDSALEAFVRTKYEQKKYIAREWIPPNPQVPKEWLEDPKNDRKKAKATKPVAVPLQLTNVSKPVAKPAVTTPPGEAPKANLGPKAEVKIDSASNDLLGLDLGSPQTNTQQAAAPPQPSGNNELLDLFGGPQTAQVSAGTSQLASGSNDLMNGASEGNLFGEDKVEEKKASTKDSILALYGGSGSGTVQPQMYGVPAHQADMIVNSSHNIVHQNGSDNLMKGQENPFLSSSHVFAQPAVNIPFSQNQFMIQPSLSQPCVAPSTSASHIAPAYSQSPAANFAGLANQMNRFGGVESVQYPAFNQTFASVPISSTIQVPKPLQSSPQKQAENSPTKQRALQELQSFGQTAWGSYNQAQPGFYGGQGGVYMPQGQQMFPAMMGQAPVAMGPAQGMRPQGMMGQPQNMMGVQGMGMMGQPGIMGQPQGMMGNPQMGMYNGQMMAGTAGMYNPQQMQQLQFQQMQQQMTSLKLNGAPLGGVPQQASSSAASWGNPGQGHTLSTNLWQ